MATIALFGLGIMGSGIAGNLLRAGHTLRLWNRTAAKAGPFAEQGAVIASTPADAVDGAAFAVSVLGDDEASRAVWLGEGGALAAVQSGTVLVECSTLSPGWVRELAGLAAVRGAGFLEAPLFGSREAAASGSVAIGVGGSPDTLERARPVLESFTGRIRYLGETGTAATWKLINNMMIAAHVAVLAEAWAMAEAAGLDMATVRELILHGGASSGIVQAKLPRMIEGAYDTPDFAVRWMLKDTRYAAALAARLGVPQHTIDAVAADYAQAADAGYLDHDFAAVLAGLRPARP